MKRFLLFTTALFLSLLAWAQDLKWIENFTDTSPDNLTVVDIEMAPDGSVFVLANFSGTIDIAPGSSQYLITSLGGKDAVIAKYAPTGQLADKYIIANDGYLSGGIDSDELAYDMTIYGNSNDYKIYVTGSFSHEMYFQPYEQSSDIYCHCSRNMFVAKLSKYLGYHWVKTPYSCDEDMITTLIEGRKIFYHSDEDEILVAGKYTGAIGITSSSDISSYDEELDLFFAKLDEDGNFLWGKSLNSTTDKQESVTNILVHPSYNYIYVGGTFKGSLDMNPSAGTHLLTSAGGRDIFIGMFSSSGNFIGSNYCGRIGSSGSEACGSMTMDHNGNIYLAGIIPSYTTLDIDIKSGVQNVSVSAIGTFIAQYNWVLSYKNKLLLKGNGNLRVKDVAHDKNDNLCVLGWFYGSANFNPNGTSYYLSAGNNSNLFLGKYNTSLEKRIVQKIGNESSNMSYLKMGANKNSSDIAIFGGYSDATDFDGGSGETFLVPNMPNSSRFFGLYGDCQPTTILAHPAGSSDYCEGETIHKHISAIGNNLTYKWRRDGELMHDGYNSYGTVDGSGSNSLTISNIAPSSEPFPYECKVMSTCDDDVYTHGIDINVDRHPIINSHPGSVTDCEGATVSFTAGTQYASSFQWLVNDGSGVFQNISNNAQYSGAQTATLTISNIQPSQSYYQYKCLVGGTCPPNLYTNSVSLVVNPNPNIQGHPSNVTVCEGTPTSMSIVTDGYGLDYQWQVSTNNGISFSNISNGANYSGTQDATLDINNPTLAYNDRIYRCVVSGDCGSSVTSNQASLSVQKEVQLNTHPENQSLCQYEDATFNVNAEGDGLEYAWQVNTGSGWVNLNNDNYHSNVSNPSLNVHSVGTDMNGNQYRCKISSPCSTPLYSNSATLNVTEVPTFSLNSSEGSDICEGTNTTLSSNLGSGSYTYQWKRNFEAVSAGTNSTLTANQSGAYTLYVEENGSGCNIESDPIMLNVHALPNNTTTLNGSNQLCEGESRQLTVPAGNGYTYQWYQDGSPMGGQTSHSLFVNASGTYHAKIISDYACENTSSDEVITVNANPVVGLTTGDAELCEGEQTTINATSNSAYNYQWKRNGNVVAGETASALQVGQAGVYSVEVVNTSTNCSAVSDPLTVNVHTLPNNNITIVGNNAFCEGLSTELTVPAGNGYTYQWYKNNTPITGQTANSLTVNETGAYKAKITSAYACENTSANENITVHPNPTVDLTADDTEICEGEQTTINATSNSAYNYQWKRNGNVVTGETANALQVSQAGVYSVEVVNSSTNCSAVSDPLTVNVRALPNNNITIVGNSAFCEGLSTELTVPAGNGYTYQWYKNNNPVAGETANSLTVSESGSYKAKIVNSYNCESTSGLATITVHPNPDVTLTTNDAEICEGVSTTINSNVGFGSYTYQWKRNGNDLVGQTANSLSVSESGGYSLELTNSATSCSTISDPISINVYSLPNNNITVIGSTTFCDGLSTELTVPAGNGYTYNWYRNNTLMPGQTSNSLTVSEEGAYKVQITGANGCQSTSSEETVSVTSLPERTLSVDNANICQGETATISVEDGESADTYKWFRNGTLLENQTGSSLSVNQSGVYSLETTNNNCSSMSVGVNVNRHSLPTAEITVVGENTICEGDYAELLASSGSGYTYQWYKNDNLINNVNSNNLNVSEPGTYKVKVINLYGCESTSGTESIAVNTLPERSLSVDNANICQGETATISVEDGESSDAYKWFRNGTLLENQTGSSLSVNQSGVYSLETTNNNCSSTSVGVNVNRHSLPTAEITVVGENTICEGDYAELLASSGSGYTYQWYKNDNLINNVNSNNLNVSEPGTYKVKVINLYGCESTSGTESIAVNALPERTLSVDNANICQGETATISVDNGASADTYKWFRNGTLLENQTGSSLSVSQSGVYSLETTNNNCSSMSVGVNVNRHSLPTAEITVVGENTICEGDYAELLASSGSGYTYQWYKNDNLINNVTSNNLNVSESGTYKVKVINLYGCESTSGTESIAVNALPERTLSVDNANICQGETAAISVDNGASADTYKWFRNGTLLENQTGNTLSVNQSGVYSLETTNNNCSSTSVGVNVNRHSLPTAEITVVGENTICEGDYAELLASSGSGYTYQWYKNDNLINNVNSNNLNVSEPGTYKVKVINLYGCESTSGTESIAVNALPERSLSVDNANICQGETATISVEDGESADTYKWFRNGTLLENQTGSSLSVNQSGVYSLETTNNNCSSMSVGVNVNRHNLPTAEITVVGENTICEGDYAELLASSGSGYTYQWYKNDNLINNVNSNNLNVSEPGTYKVKVINLYGCENTSGTESIAVNALPERTLSVDNANICQGETATISVEDGESADTYKWFRNGTLLENQTGSSLSVNQSGVYSLETTNNNCSSMSVGVNVNRHNLPTAEITVVGENTICEGDYAELLASSGSGYTYQWYKNDNLINNVTSNNLNVSESGTYKVKVTNLYGCENISANENITVHPNPTVNLITTDAEICEGEQTSIEATSNTDYTYQWRRNGNILTEETERILETGQAGVYSVSVVNMATSCSAVSAPLSVGVHALPNSNITIVGNNAFCEGLSAELTVPAGNGYTYQWYHNNNPIEGQISNSLIVSEGGNYTAKVLSAYGCENTSEVEAISINPNPVVDLTTDDAEICEGEQTVINATYNSDYTYQWKYNGNILAEETESSLETGQAGVYSVSVINTTTNCKSTSVGLPINVHSAPNNNITLIGSAVFCEGFSSQLTLPAGNGQTYQWYRDSVLINNQTSNTLTVVESGDYYAHISDAYGCENTTSEETVTVIANPEVSISTDDAEICEGEATSIEATLNADYTYQWKYNGNLISGEVSNTLDVSQSGVYNVIVIDTVTSCISTSEGLSVNVHTLPNNNITLIGDDVFCEGFSSELTIPAGNGHTYEWYKDGVLIINQSSNSLTVSETGTYYAHISDTYGCESTSLEESITVHPNPEVDLTSDNTEICEGEATSIEATLNTDYTYQWKRNGVALDNETNHQVEVGEAGVYSVEILNTITSCSVVSEPLSIGVHALPNNNITLIGSPVFCEGLSAELTVPAGNGYAYQWYQNDTPIEGQNSNSLTVTESGAYHAEISDAYGCESVSDKDTIMVSPSPEVTLTIEDSEICQGTETTISTEENSDYFYQWLHNNSEIPGATSHSVQVSEEGLYKVSVINTATGCSGISDYTVVSVNPLPNPELSVSGDLTVCVEDTVELYLDQTYSQYLWQDQSTNASLPIYSAGNYMVTVTDENNCQNSAEIEINEILVPTPDICMVTVDTSLNKNLIVWETLTDVAGIASYNIYKMEANDYVLLGNILYGDTTEFVDMTSEPDIHADKYVIASVDQCGNVGAYSPYHQTMSLSINSSVTDDANLIWTRYIDESGVNNPTEYEIYRGVNEWSYHASVPGGFSGDTYVYTVDNIQEGERFIVVVQRPESCAPLNGVDGLKANGGPYYQSISNLEDEGMIHTDIQGLETTLFRVYPNPAKDRITIQSDKLIERVRLLDVSSKVVLDQKGNAGNEFGLDLHIFAKGLYFIEVNGQKSKLVIE